MNFVEGTTKASPLQEQEHVYVEEHRRVSLIGALILSTAFLVIGFFLGNWYGKTSYVPIPEPKVAVTTPVKPAVSQNKPAPCRAIPYDVRRGHMLTEAGSSIFENGSMKVARALAKAFNIEANNPKLWLRIGRHYEIPCELKLEDGTILHAKSREYKHTHFLHPHRTAPAPATEPLPVLPQMKQQTSPAELETVPAPPAPSIAPESSVQRVPSSTAFETEEEPGRIPVLLSASFVLPILKTDLPPPPSPAREPQKDAGEWRAFSLYPDQLSPGIRSALKRSDPGESLAALELEGPHANRRWSKRQQTVVHLAQGKNGVIYGVVRLTKPPSPTSGLAFHMQGVPPIQIGSNVLMEQGRALNEPPPLVRTSPPPGEKEYRLLKKKFKLPQNILVAGLSRALPFVTMNGVAYIRGSYVGMAIVDTQSVMGMFRKESAPVASPEFIMANELKRIQALETRVGKIEEKQNQPKGIEQ